MDCWCCLLQIKKGSELNTQSTKNFKDLEEPPGSLVGLLDLKEPQRRNPGTKSSLWGSYDLFMSLFTNPSSKRCLDSLQRCRTSGNTCMWVLQGCFRVRLEICVFTEPCDLQYDLHRDLHSDLQRDLQCDLQYGSGHWSTLSLFLFEHWSIRHLEGQKRVVWLSELWCVTCVCWSTLRRVHFMFRLMNVNHVECSAITSAVCFHQNTSTSPSL